jgi:hypothetical protein
MTYNYAQQLHILKKKLAAEQMSLLVGSGFSKNVSPKFPTWDELLSDLTEELYHEEIESNFLRHIEIVPMRNRQRRSKFVLEKIKSILRREGYLEVVSRYVARKGFAEAIAAYIEERTPYIHRAGEHIVLTVNGVPENISAERLALHRIVVQQLPWNNIYTTNYDELLDFCVDPQIIPELQNNIHQINEQIDMLNQRESELLAALSELDRNPSTEVSPTGDSASPEELFSEPETPAEKNPAQRRYDLNYELGNVRKENEEKQQQIRNLEAGIKNSYVVITYAAGLKLRRNRNIVKLHGSLRSPSQRRSNYFEFDGDFKNQYIISGEDYRNYPEKHEAFTQLMRISLLQESFCLLGFSGVDPNFLAWIGWVRDILQKHAHNNTGDPDYKIYLIDIDSTPDTADRKLFFENHSIVRIPIRIAEILNVVDTGHQHDDEISPREAMRLFLEYLASDEDLKPVIPTKDLAVEQDRKTIWRDLRFAEPNKKISADTVKKTVTRLDNLGNNIFLPDMNHAYAFNQHSLLGAAATQLNFYKSEQDVQDLICRLTLHAAKDYMVPIYNVVEQQVVDQMLKVPEIQQQTQSLIERAETLSLSADETTTENVYEQLLRIAYSMRYDALKIKLENWQPKGKGVLQKAGLLSLFDPKSASEIIEENLKNYDDLTGEERLYAYELLSYFKLSGTWKRSKKLDKTVSLFEHSGFRTLNANFEYLQQQLAPKPEKIQPYGKGRFSTGRSIQWVSFTKKEIALQYLMLLAESGVQMSIKGVNFQSAQDWYYVFKIGFEMYPQPFLYYSIQHGGDDFLKRVGQDYAFSEKLAGQLPWLMKNLFVCQQTAPEHIRSHTFYVLSEFFIAVPPEDWEPDFMESWRAGVREGYAFIDRHNPENPYFINGIKYIASKAAITEIIKDCLESIGKEKAVMGIDFLYYLNFNQHFKAIKSSKTISANLRPQIDQIIRDLPGKIDTNLFVLGNIYDFLNDTQINSVKIILEKEDYSKINHVRIWHIILYFVHKDKATVKLVASAILRNKALWYTGIEGKTILGGVESIDVGRITKNPDNKRGITWSIKELHFLYEKIKSVLPLIQVVVDGRQDDGFASFADVLEDMLGFLNSHKERLKSQNDLSAVIDQTQSLFFMQRNFESLTQGLLSDDNSPIVWALNETNRCLRAGRLDEPALNLILSRAMLQHQPGLEACLFYLANWVNDKKTREQVKSYTYYLKQLLQKYLDNPPVEVDFPYVQAQLISIAIALKRQGESDRIISEWLAKAEKSNFNNIRQQLMKKSADN